MGLLRAVRALKIDRRVGAKLKDHLAACTAGGARCPLIVRDGDGLDFYLGPQLRHRRKDGGSLGAIGHAVRRVFHVASDENLAIGQEDRRSNMEIRIRSVSILHHLACRVLKLLPNTGDRLLLDYRQSSLRVLIDDQRNLPNRAPL